MTLRATADKTPTPVNKPLTVSRPVRQAAQVTTLAEQLFDQGQDTPSGWKRRAVQAKYQAPYP
jgi:hypothetical protein